MANTNTNSHDSLTKRCYDIRRSAFQHEQRILAADLDKELDDILDDEIKDVLKEDELDQELVNVLREDMNDPSLTPFYPQ